MVKIYADGASLEEMREMAANPLIKGFTTNPTLMRKAGVKDYKEFAQAAIKAFPEYPISLEVFADDFDTMEAQARLISSWGDNVYVKIPITNTHGAMTTPLITKLAKKGIKLNITAIMDQSQIWQVIVALTMTPAIISVFAGRLADIGIDPELTVSLAVWNRRSKNHEVLWASPRQVLDVWIADRIGCDIITVTKDILTKVPLKGKTPKEYSLETVQMFYDDAQAAGYRI